LRRGEGKRGQEEKRVRWGGKGIEGKIEGGYGEGQEKIGERGETRRRVGAKWEDGGRAGGGVGGAAG